MQNEPPVPIFQPQVDELFGKEELWLAMLEPGHTEIPDGCNFILWFETDRSPEELLNAFRSKGWQAQVGYSGFTLTQIVPIRHLRSGRIKDYEINIAAMVSAKSSNLSVLAGNCTYPHSIGTEFRELVLRLEGQSNNLFCLYINSAGTLQREVPATAELLGMNSCSLSDADRAVLNTGYIVQRATDSCMTIDDLPASSSSVQDLQNEVRLLSPSVVVDEEGYTHITCWPYSVRRLWNQVREVRLLPDWGPNFMFVNFYVWVKGEGFEDSICLKSGLSDQSSRSFGIVSGVGPARGVSEFLNRLDVLPGFSLKDLETALRDEIVPRCRHSAC